MFIQEFSDARTFLDRSRGFLNENEDVNNLLISSALALSRNGVPRLPQLAFFAAFRENGGASASRLEKPVATLLQAPNKRLITSTAEPDVASFLGRELAKRPTSFRGVFGPTRVATAFVESFAETSGQRPSLHFSQVLMKVEELQDVPPADGVFRLAQPRDISTLIQWSYEFARECQIDETQSETEEVTRRYVEAKQLFVWDLGGSKPVAMAAYGGLTPSSARISMVYTNKSARGKRYASTLVHRLTHRLLTNGVTHCLLFADSKNTVSIHVYEKLGFRKVALFDDYRFTDGSQPQP